MQTCRACPGKLHTMSSLRRDSLELPRIKCDGNITQQINIKRKLYHRRIFIFISCCLIESSSSFIFLALHFSRPPPPAQWGSRILDSEMFLCCIDFCFQFRAAQTALTPVYFSLCTFSVFSLSFLLMIYQLWICTVRSTVNQANRGWEVKGDASCYIISTKISVFQTQSAECTACIQRL